MRYLLIASLAFTLGACAAGRDRTSRPDPLAVALDGTPVVPPALPYAATHPVPKKCKGCSFYAIAGDATVAGKKAQVAAGEGAALTITGKKSGPVITADSGAHVATSGQGIAQAGHDNKASMPAAAPKKTFLESIGDGIGRWLIPIACVAGAGVVLVHMWPSLVGWWASRKKSTDNQA